jgi:gamma-glutamyl-gamma-aminobutyrate hydrolase PuuD
MPVLGICRGIQILNVAFGGKLVQHIPGHRNQGQRSAYHEVFISPGSKLAVIVGQGHGGFPLVNSRHHQGVLQEGLAQGLRACAYSPREGIIEAVESHEHPFLVGVQWHPEREEDYQPKGLMAPKFRSLFGAFVRACEAYQERRA